MGGARDGEVVVELDGEGGAVGPLGRTRFIRKMILYFTTLLATSTTNIVLSIHNRCATPAFNACVAQRRVYLVKSRGVLIHSRSQKR